MKTLALVSTLVVGALGCRIAPVLTDPSQRSEDHYSQCREAARDYCKKVVNVSADDLDRCVAEHAFRCVSGSR